MEKIHGKIFFLKIPPTKCSNRNVEEQGLDLGTAAVDKVIPMDIPPVNLGIC